MRRCNDCRRKSPDEALFCRFCAATFDLKLCPHRHPNPRDARYCTQCGSHELSRPHHAPRIDSKFILRLIALLAAITVLLFLYLASH